MSIRYKIRSPIDIWTAYGGDQQRIAQAMQLGVIRPEEGVLAVMEGKRKPPPPAAPGTVAQQVMGIVPPPTNPMASNMGAPAPQPAPPMQAPMGAPPMGAPMGAPPAPMPGMAMGGIASLPIPGAMFDEPDNGGYGDGYAGGGLVAFADGGEASDPLSWLYSPISSVYGVNRPTGAHSGHDFAVRGNTPIGAPAPGVVTKVGRDDVNGNFVVVRHPDGTSSSYSHLANPSVAEGEEINTGQVIGLSGNTGRVRGKGGGYHLHFGTKDAEGNRTNPTDFLKTIAPQVSSGKWSQQLPERDISTAQGRASSREDLFEALNRRFGPSEREKTAKEAMYARAEEMASDEYYEKERKGAMWQTLAELGFNMASSKSPYLLQAVGEAAAAAMPGARADKKERKALKDRALNLMVELGARDRKEALQMYGVAVELDKDGRQQEQFDRKIALDERQIQLAEDKFQADLDAAARQGADPEKVAVSYMLNYAPGTPQYEAAKRYYETRYGKDGSELEKDLEKGLGGGSGGRPTAADVAARYQ